MHRGHVCLLGGFLLHLALGTIYSWGSISPYVTSYLRKDDPELTSTDTIVAYAVGLFVQSSFMSVGGAMESRLGPRVTTLIGGLCFSTSVLLCSAYLQYTTFVVLYGGVFGASIGMAYMAPMVCCFKWFPDKKGMVSGVITSGFGGGAFLFNQVASYIANPNNLKPIAEGPDKGYYSEEVYENVPHMFMILGLSYLVLTFVGSMLLVNPEEGTQYKPIGREEENEETVVKEENINMSPAQVWASPLFYLISLSFMLTGNPGALILGAYKGYATEYPNLNDDKYLTLVGSMASIGNCLGRIFFGKVCDKIGWRKTMMCVSALLGTTMITYPSIVNSSFLFGVWTFVTVFCHGGNFAVYPIGAGDLFGKNVVGTNFGFMFLFFGVSALVGIFSMQKMSLSFMGITMLLSSLAFGGLMTLFSIGKVIAYSNKVLKADRSSV